ncbi:MAG: hypothetical protein ACU837_00370 [Gammaproteobacteria bacterium]
MHRIRCLLLLAAWLAFPVRGAAPEVPEPLKPWVGWVLQEHRDYRCPFVYNSFAEKRCVWASRLTLATEAQKGLFALDAAVYAESWVQLPGDADYWPQQVTLDNQPAQVLERYGSPALYLPAGNYRIAGVLLWDALPETLALPPDSGLIALTVEGRDIPLPHLKDGRLWIKSSAAAGAQLPQDVQNKVELQVFRRIIDDVPLQIVTRIDMDVSGMPREIKLPPPLLADFIPMRLYSPLPARLEADGQLLLQVRPGHWHIELLARHAQPVLQLPLPNIAAPWPDEEVWAFDAHPYQRVVEIKNLAAIDPQQTNLPAEWRKFPAYRLKQGDSLQFTLIRRGDSDPKPNQLSLQRRLWLDFDGGGYTVSDRIAGTMTQSRRLNALPELQLGRVSLDGVSQLITRLPGSEERGVEVRSGAINLSADSRIEPRIGAFSAVGWQQTFQQVSAELNLPPGWRLIGANGVDNVPDSWISRWTLLDLFVVLIAALAVARLWTLPWGLFALLTLSLIWHEPDAPRYVWLHILAAAALLKVLPAGKFAAFVKLYRNVFWLALVLMAIPFMIEQIRTGLYPQLESPDKVAQPRHYGMGRVLDMEVPPTALQSPAPAETEIVASDEAEGARRDSMVTLRSMAKSAHKPAAGAEPSAVLQRIDPNANIQTGPGLPQWQWRRIALSWNGPVDADQPIRLWLLSPAMTLLLNLLRVAALALLALLLSDSVHKRLRLHGPPSLAGMLLLPFLLLPPEPAQADFPGRELLEELQQRLLQAPECTPDCAQISHMQVDIAGDHLRIGLQIHAGQRVAVPLPAQAEQWLPQNATLDGKPAAGLYRDAQGVLWLSLSEGRHAVALQGRIALQRKFSLPLPLQPHRVDVAARDWQVDGVHEHGLADAQLQFTRVGRESSGASPAALQPAMLPPFVSVERTLQLSLDWRVHTRVLRLTPPDAAVVLAVPLLPGEAVTSVGVHVKDGKVLVNMPPQQNETRWESVLEKSPQLDLIAADTTQWVEVWRADVSPIWHLRSEGLTAVHPSDPRGAWLPEWRPWPGEQLRLTITRPEAVPGPTVTVDKSVLHLSPGSRALQASLELQLRTSKGGHYSLYLPENADLQTVSIDGASQPLRLKNRQLIVPTRPGTQNINVVWRQNQALALLFRTPAVQLETASVNSHVQVKLGEDRWTLLTFGPRLGPAVLFWGTLAVIVLLAYGLGRIRLTPLKPRQWFLLLLGLSQIPLAAAATVVGWLLVLGLRAARPLTGVKTFNAVQIGLGLLSLLALLLLFFAVQQGLLGRPDMQIGGNHSSAYQLNWYQDRSTVQLPAATAVSVPLFCYRLLMLAWSLWLALALLDWLKWGWGCFADGGMWKKKPSS